MTPGFAHKGTVGVAVEDGSHQPLLKFVELDARIAQPGDLNDRLTSDVPPGAGWQRQQIDAAGRDVLAEVTRHDRVTACLQFLEQLGMDQMDLTQVRWVGSRATPDRCFTVAPQCASTSTPSPARSRMLSWAGLLNAWRGWELTAMTIGCPADDCIGRFTA